MESAMKTLTNDKLKVCLPDIDRVRRLDLLKGKADCTIHDDFKLNDEEFFAQ